MSRRSIIKKYQVLSGADSTANQSSVATDVSGVDSVNYEVSVAASVVATLSVYYSNDKLFDAATAKQLNFGQSTPLNGGLDTNYLIQIENCGFKWLQVRTVNNGGTGVISAWVAGTVGGA